MQLGGKVRSAVDQVTAAADNTRQAITVIGAVAAVALIVGLVALAVSARRPR
jgi:hypothetical protein